MAFIFISSVVKTICVVQYSNINKRITDRKYLSDYANLFFQVRYLWAMTPTPIIYIFLITY